MTYIFLLDRDLHNFADENTISAVSETISELVDSLTSKSNLAIDWFDSNSMIVNPDKFAAFVLTKSGQDTSETQISLKDNCITSENTVILLCIKIDCRLSFEKHVSKLCQAVASKLYAVKRLRPYIMNEKTGKIVIHSFVSCHFNYCPLVWYFATAKELQSLKISKKELYDSSLMITYRVHVPNFGGVRVRGQVWR